MPPDLSWQGLFKRERLIVVIGLLAVTAMAWAYLLTGAGTEMGTHGATPGALTPARWNAGYAALMFLMWWVMMIAMMLPSAAPMVLLFAALEARLSRPRPGATALFVLAYLIAWGGFSVLATALQWGLARAGLVSGAAAAAGPGLAAALLIAAGFWQCAPLKHACLRHCRAPVRFLTERRREGRAGAFVMGLEHGLYCLGCCWFLMALLFVGGVMNLYWVAGLALYVLLEKTIPHGHLLGAVLGVGLVAWGLTLFVLAAL